MPLTNSKGQHIDIQSTGSYVLGPESIHPNGNPYEIISTTTNILEFDVSISLSILKSGVLTQIKVALKDLMK